MSIAIVARAYGWIYRLGVSVSVLAGLFVVLSGVVGMEATYRSGQDFYLTIRPVDPRSLLQGDYMALAFEADTEAAPDDDGVRYAVLSLDDQGLAALVRHDKSAGPLAPGQVALPVKRWGNRYLIQPRSFLFQEGQARGLREARYAVFRFTDPKAPLLYGLADADFQMLDHK